MKFPPHTALAILPEALATSFADAVACPNETTSDGKVCIVRVSGVLTYAHALMPTYDGAVERVREALACSADTIVLAIDSPGGEVAGMLDAAREIRKMAIASGKTLVGFAANYATSAAYALMLACPRIVISETATIGSIGVITELSDTTAAEAAAGVRIAVVTSGERKADGNPHVGISDAVLASAQQIVDAKAARFFAWAAETRQIDAEPLQANIFVGHGAVAMGLADSVASLPELLAELAQPSQPTTLGQAPMAEDDKKPPQEDAVLAALHCAVDDKDPEKAARAKRALAAYEGKEDCAEAPKDEDGDDDKPKPPPSAVAATVALAASVQALQARIDARDARDERDARAAILASRPDLAPEIVKSLAAVPLASMRAVINALPKPGPNPLVPEVAAPVHGEVSEARGLTGAAKAALDEACGIVEHKFTVKNTTYRQQFGAPETK